MYYFKAEGFKVPIEVQPMYKYFMEMYDYTNFIQLTTKSFVLKSLCAVSNDTTVSRDGTIVKQLPARVPAKQNVYKYYSYNLSKTFYQ